MIISTPSICLNYAFCIDSILYDIFKTYRRWSLFVLREVRGNRQGKTRQICRD